MNTINKPLKLNSSEVNIFFTSDLHFHHNNIIKFCNRPFSSVEEMNETLISNWNNVVKENDIVFDLGDFSFGNNKQWRECIQALNGKHYLILGNHCITRYPSDSIMNMFYKVEQQMILKIDNRTVYLNHYPYLCFGGSYKNPDQAVWQLFGHVHLNPYKNDGKDVNRLVNLFPYQYDVGVDNNNYTPVSWNQIKEIINKQVENYDFNRDSK